MAEKRQTETRTSQSQEERGIQRSPARRELSLWREPFGGFGYGPFAMFRRMQDEMDRLFGGFGGRQWPALFGGEQGGDWMPAIETFQRGTEFVIRAEVPGLSRNDLNVEVKDDSVIIRGERKHDYEEEHEGVFRSERAYGSFYRVLPLPEGAVTESAKANFKDGVLEIVVQAPSHEARRGRRIEIGQESTEPAEQRR
jgi:HSP20 family protein